MNDPRVSCDGKDKLTASRAREIAHRMPGSGAYHCQHCRAWHIGHRQPHKVMVSHKRPRFYDNDGSDDT